MRREIGGGMRLLLALILGAASAAGSTHGRGGLRSVRLRVANETRARGGGEERRWPKDALLGDLSCMRWTGGLCSTLPCRDERGPTLCEQGHCMCDYGHCASAAGACIAAEGSWVGRHSLSFGRPFDPIRPYVASFGVAPPSMYDEHGSEAEAHGVTHYLETTSSAEPVWDVALTGEGHIRLESAIDPGHVLSIYHNRRRRTDLLQRAASTADRVAEPARAGGAIDDPIDDSDDLWPVLVHLRSAHPLDVTFRARPTRQDGGGLELWHPQTGHALAAADPHWLFRDRVAAWGVAECRTPTAAYSGNCAGRQLVDFRPPLPEEATLVSEHEYIKEITVLTEAQALMLLVGICIFCSLCLCFVP